MEKVGYINFSGKTFWEELLWRYIRCFLRWEKSYFKRL